MLQAHKQLKVDMLGGSLINKYIAVFNTANTYGNFAAFIQFGVYDCCRSVCRIWLNRRTELFNHADDCVVTRCLRVQGNPDLHGIRNCFDNVLSVYIVPDVMGAYFNCALCLLRRCIYND